MGVERRGRLIVRFVYLSNQGTDVLVGGDELASRVRRTSRLTFRRVWCGRHIRALRRTRVRREWTGAPSTTSMRIGTTICTRSGIGCSRGGTLPLLCGGEVVGRRRA